MTNERLTYYFNKYRHRLTWFMRQKFEDNELIDDVVSDCFLSLMNIEDRGPGQIYSYLKTRSKNQYINVLKKKQRSQILHIRSSYNQEASYVQSIEIKHRLIAEAARQKEIIAYIKWHLGKRPPAEQKVFKMRFFQEMTNVEIAFKLKISTGAVGAQLKKSVDHIKGVVIKNRSHLLWQQFKNRDIY